MKPETTEYKHLGLAISDCALILRVLFCNKVLRIYLLTFIAIIIILYVKFKNKGKNRAKLGKKQGQIKNLLFFQLLFVSFSLLYLPTLFVDTNCNI